MAFTWTIVALVVALALCWRFLGSYIVTVYERRMRWLSVVERPIYRLLRLNPESEQSWQRYAASVISFSGVALLMSYGIFRLQSGCGGADPWIRPQGLPHHRQFLGRLHPGHAEYHLAERVGQRHRNAEDQQLFGGWLTIAGVSERQANPAVAAAGVAQQPGGNMEGKETRFGPLSSSLYDVTSTQTSTPAASTRPPIPIRRWVVSRSSPE